MPDGQNCLKIVDPRKEEIPNRVFTDDWLKEKPKKEKNPLRKSVRFSKIEKDEPDERKPPLRSELTRSTIFRKNYLDRTLSR